MEDAFCWIRNELHAGESIDSIHAEGCEDEAYRSFVLVLVKQHYDESAPPKEAIDVAEARAREVLDAMEALEVKPREKQVSWRRHIRIVDVVYRDDGRRENNPATADLATLALMINEDMVFGGDDLRQTTEIPTALGIHLAMQEGRLSEQEIREKCDPQGEES